MEQWSRVVKRFLHEKPNLGSYLEKGVVQDWIAGEAKDVLVIGYDEGAAFFAEYIQKEESQPIIASALREVFQRPVELECPHFLDQRLEMRAGLQPHRLQVVAGEQARRVKGFRRVVVEQPLQVVEHIRGGPLGAVERDQLVNRLSQLAVGGLPAALDTNITYTTGPGGGNTQIERRVETVTLPSPSATNTARPGFTIRYATFNAGTGIGDTYVYRAGGGNPAAYPADWDRKVQYNWTGQGVYDAATKDGTNYLESGAGYDDKDRVLWSKAVGRITTYTYDSHGWLTDVWGPADQNGTTSCWTAAGATFTPNIGVCTTLRSNP